MEEARSEIEILPDHVLLKIFRYLRVKHLQLAEQVCERWKAVVETRFATITTLDLRQSHEDCVKLVKRCGPSLQSLFMCEWLFWNKQLNCVNDIAEALPNLKSLKFQFLNIDNENCRNLFVECHQLRTVSMDTWTFSEEGLGLLLKGLPGLQHLSIRTVAPKRNLGECFSHLGDNLEHLSVSCWRNEITTAGFSHLFSKCKKVKTLELKGHFDCDELFSNWCQENVSVRNLIVGWSPLTKLSFSKISCLSLLEELGLCGCDAIDSDTLVDISRGCLNLRRVRLYHLKNICDRGVKSLSGCRSLSEFICSNCNGVTDESLVELGQSGSLKRVTVFKNSRITNSSCAAILGHCPQLEELRVTHCREVVDGIVDTAIQAIENRANGVVLHLHIEHTGVDPEKETRTHPLLIVYHQLKYPITSLDRIPF